MQSKKQTPKDEIQHLREMLEKERQERVRLTNRILALTEKKSSGSNWSLFLLCLVIAAGLSAIVAYPELMATLDRPLTCAFGALITVLVNRIRG